MSSFILGLVLMSLLALLMLAVLGAVWRLALVGLKAMLHIALLGAVVLLVQEAQAVAALKLVLMVWVGWIIFRRVRKALKSNRGSYLPLNTAPRVGG